MKNKYVLLLFFLIFVPSIFAFENSIFLDIGSEYLTTDREVRIDYDYTGLSYSSIWTNLNIGWYGRFNNGLCLLTDFEFGYLLNMAHSQIKEDLPKYLLLYKYGLGLGYMWNNFLIYGTPNVFIINDSSGINGSIGIKGFFNFNWVSLSAGLEYNTPNYFIYNNNPFSTDFSIKLSVGLIFGISKKINLERQRENIRLAEIERQRLQEEERQRRLEEQKIAHEAMLRENGLTEEEWQTQENERRRLQEIRRQQEQREQNALSQLIQNILDYGVNVGEPFQVGDIVSIPYGLFTSIDYSRIGEMNSYLVIMNDPTTRTKPFYIETTRQLNTIGPIRVEYIGTAQYLDGRVPRSTIRFREVR